MSVVMRLILTGEKFEFKCEKVDDFWVDTCDVGCGWGRKKLGVTLVDESRLFLRR